MLEYGNPKVTSRWCGVATVLLQRDCCNNSVRLVIELIEIYLKSHGNDGNIFGFARFGFR